MMICFRFGTLALAAIIFPALVGCASTVSLKPHLLPNRRIHSILSSYAPSTSQIAQTPTQAPPILHAQILVCSFITREVLTP